MRHRPLGLCPRVRRVDCGGCACVLDRMDFWWVGSRSGPRSTATESLAIQMTNINIVGSVIDGATRAGANTINGPGPEEVDAEVEIVYTIAPA
jgi:hypothetical protein